MKSLTYSGYRKFGAQPQTVEVAYPDLKTPGSGLNIIVGGIGSGKSSLLELIWLNAGNGLDDNDKLVINDTVSEGMLPTLSAVHSSPAHETQQETTYTTRLEFSLNGRRLQPAFVNEIADLDEEDRPNNSQLAQYRRANRVFKGSGRFEGNGMATPMPYEGVDNSSRTDTMNLAGVAYFLTKDNGMGGSNIEVFRERLNKLSYLGLEIEDVRITEPARGAEPITHFEGKLRSGKWHNIQDFSDGTKELLWWLYELNWGDTANHRIICIDEIERSLHPQVQEALMQIILEKSSHQQFFITTHSVHIADPYKAARVHRLNGNGLVKSVPQSDFPKHSVFQVDHRRLFFTDHAVFVEGVNDLTYYSQRAKDFDLGGVAGRMFTLGSKDAVDAFEKLCLQLGIGFAAIVDDDFTEKSHQLSSGKRAFLEKIIKALQDKASLKSAIDVDELDRELVGSNPVRANRKSEEVAGKHYRKVKDRNIFPLKYGRLEEYKAGTDRSGESKRAEQDAELQEILAASIE